MKPYAKRLQPMNHGHGGGGGGGWLIKKTEGQKSCDTVPLTFFCFYSYAWIISLALLYWARNSMRLTSSPAAASSCQLPSPAAGTPSHQLEQQLLQRAPPNQLPSWVLFPDVERAEWMNVILRKVWPNLGEIARQIAKRLVEPKIKVIFWEMSSTTLGRLHVRLPRVSWSPRSR
jgi:hypothetical protein